MGRRAYLNRLALGRSPYEAPEHTSSSLADATPPTVRRTSALHADGYVQHYDERGHPVNTESKNFGRELRRAKNDILSTMGIVVSEDGNRGRSEQEKIDMIVAENDYGLVMNHFPNNDTGSKLVRASFTILHSAGVLLVLAMQTYIYSLLQSLHLIHHTSFPGIGFLVPFGEFAAMQLPHFPADLSVHSLSAFVLNLFKAPSLFYIYVYLRPLIEIRLYRFIRRRLPKPSLSDDLSIKVAFDNDLIDWMVPTLGRRSEEEMRRSNLSFMDDLLYELSTFQQWMSSKLSFRRKRATHVPRQAPDISRGQECPESLPGNTEHIHTTQSSQPPIRSATDSHLPLQEQPHDRDIIASNSMSSSDVDPDGRRAISDEENQIPSPPAETGNGDIVDLTPLRRARHNTPTEDISPPREQEGRHDDAGIDESTRDSRSDTLLSQSSSTSSSQSSPQVRAQVIQNSDVIAMELQLESHHTQGQAQGNHRPGNDSNRPALNGEPADRRSISDFIDSLLSNQGQNLATILNSETMDSDALSNLTTGASPEVGDNATPLVPFGRPDDTTGEQLALESTVEPPVSSSVNILPDVVEEPSHDDTNLQISDVQPNMDNDLESDIFPHISDPSVRPSTATGAPAASSPAHRVTILSALPVDSLASHLASMITTALFVPLESFYLRSLAASYLSSTGASPALRSDVYGLGVWCGAGSRSDALAYMGKMTLMMGMQAAMNVSVWGIISGTAIRIGRRWCGWGSL
ncbi:hypothetical protein AOCH_002488 [Aspergillus ochraceoroseus]|uniref:Uncharacterized protein n=1 Tax=Aspergillus ochraceoroseus TaxID=138278 RepID=A0A0F8V3W2_9EURO|nr:hypothetical protein AOCH_002488 [Aspergillus ochraceoroseus]